jgi:hypothetical protein
MQASHASACKQELQIASYYTATSCRFLQMGTAIQSLNAHWERGKDMHTNHHHTRKGIMLGRYAWVQYTLSKDFMVLKYVISNALTTANVRLP